MLKGMAANHLTMLGLLAAFGLAATGEACAAELDDRLIAAIKARDAKQAAILLEHGANPNFVIEYHSMPSQKTTAPLLILAANHGPNAEIVLLLIKKGASPDAATNRGWTALHSAAVHGYTEIIEALLKAGIAINIQNNNGYTPLIAAIHGGSLPAARMLVSRGADINSGDKRDGPPLHNAILHNIRNSRLGIIELLLKRGADVNSRGAAGDTPLHIAIWARGGAVRSVVPLLIKSGADVNAENAKGVTPIALAKQSGDAALVEYLSARGAR